MHLDGPSYEDARLRVYNAGVDFAPRLVVTPEDTADVRAAVLATVEHDPALNVLGGGYGPFTGRLGLALDNLLGLFWALRAAP